MSIFNQFDPKKQPKYKIELHVHLDGAVRLTTIWELAQKKGIDLQSDTLDDLITKCGGNKASLADFLAPFALIMPVISGDLLAIERVAYEFCEDISKQGVIYAEVRYCPHTLCSNSSEKDTSLSEGKVTPKRVVESVNKGLKRGEKDCKIKVRSILCCARAHPEWSQEILDLCKEFKDKGVVGIDIAGDEKEKMASPGDIAVFKEAAKLGIHRTAHAAEAGPASNAAIAIEQMLVERIGHGYHTVDDEEIYKKCLDRQIHFETCPHSSYMTHSVPVSTAKHPIIRFAEDNANFSISRDDPFITQKTLEQEYKLLQKLGMRSVHIVRANLNAARSCFLPELEKKELISCVKAVFGVEDVTEKPIEEPFLELGLGN